MTPFGPYIIHGAGLSDIGRRRTNNEDALLLLEKQGVFCVADGVGGSEGSELASQAVVRELQAAFQNVTLANTAGSPALPDAETVARKAINRASAWIFERAHHPETAGMASTVITLLIPPRSPERFLTLHAGDSRCYRFRDRRLQLMTCDHSGAELAGIRDQEIIPEYFHNLITRAVGTHPGVDLELTTMDARGGDSFLLCSDGLNRMLPDAHIEAILKSGPSGAPLPTVKALVHAANDAGGADNITVILIRFQTASSAEHES